MLRRKQARQAACTLVDADLITSEALASAIATAEQEYVGAAKVLVVTDSAGEANP